MTINRCFFLCYSHPSANSKLEIKWNESFTETGSVTVTQINWTEGNNKPKHTSWPVKIPSKRYPVLSNRVRQKRVDMLRLENVSGKYLIPVNKMGKTGNKIFCNISFTWAKYELPTSSRYAQRQCNGNNYIDQPQQLSNNKVMNYSNPRSYIGAHDYLQTGFHSFLADIEQLAC